MSNPSKNAEQLNRGIIAASKGKQPTAISPPKKALNGGLSAIGHGEGRPSAKSDINLQAADGPKVGPSVNNENNLFNKHYNKELKLCEGK